MRSVVVYYSFSGNTHRVAGIMVDILNKKGEVAIPVRIRPLNEKTSFLAQCKDAFLSKKPELYRTLTDLKDYDRIILGSPVWALKPAPAVNTYLETAGPLKDKIAICFATYGSGTGKDRALDIMKKKLESKGARVTGTISFRQEESEGSIREKLGKIF